jgi:hypothetical protein
MVGSVRRRTDSKSADSQTDRVAGEEEDKPTWRCPRCSSWRLIPLTVNWPPLVSLAPPSEKRPRQPMKCVKCGLRFEI